MKHIHYVLIGICLSILILYLVFFEEKEGFNTFNENVDYTPYFKEVFLVAPDQAGRADNYVDLYGSIIPVNPYTYDEAVAVCNEHGGDLATLDQLTKATNNFGANWCPGGWVKDQRGALYYPMQKNGTCSIPNDPLGLKTMTPYSGGTRGYPICYAVKPPNPTRFVRDFNSSSYNMVSSDILNTIINGKGGLDIFPIVFSPSQAYYALEQNGYDPAAARNALKNPTTRATYNEAILVKSGRTLQTNAEKTSNASTASCADLNATKTDFETKLANLKRSFEDLSGAVYSAIAAKDENTNYIQSQVTTICKNPPPDSPNVADACARLLSLDYDIFYRNLDPTGKTQRNLITDLETINMALAMEECTLQKNFGALKFMMDAVCPDTSRTWTTLKNNTMNGNIISCVYPEDRATIPDSAFKVGSDIQLNGVYSFKYNLEQISPYFNTDKYASLLTNVLNQLSVTMRTPLPEQYINPENSFKRANVYAERIFNFLK
jgi:hypothetical protein